jgi:hypothetical protein
MAKRLTDQERYRIVAKQNAGLLTALKAMLVHFDFGDQLPGDHPIVAARAAVANAEGRAQ